MESPIIIDNCIPKTLQDMIEREVFSLHLPWYFLDNITFSGKKFDDKILTTNYGFNHTFVSIERNEVMPIHTLFFPIISCALEKLKLPYDTNRFYGGRLFLQLPDGNPNRHNNPHIDREQPHWVFLYYVNESDGDTILFDKTTLDISPSEYNLRMKQNNFNSYIESAFKVSERITPKKGTCIIFDGARYHASSSPTVNKRCVVNINYAK